MCRSLVFWKTSSTLIRGSVALRPLFFSSSAWVMREGPARGKPIESFHDTSLAGAAALVGRTPNDNDPFLFAGLPIDDPDPVSYTHLRAHETDSYLVCRL